MRLDLEVQSDESTAPSSAPMSRGIKRFLEGESCLAGSTARRSSIELKDGIREIISDDRDFDQIKELKRVRLEEI